MPGPMLFLPGPGPWANPSEIQTASVTVEAIVPLETASGGFQRDPCSHRRDHDCPGVRPTPVAQRL